MVEHYVEYEEQTPNGKWIYTHRRKCQCPLQVNHVVRLAPKEKK
jgi:hypothetical protein